MRVLFQDSKVCSVQFHPICFYILLLKPQSLRSAFDIKKDILKSKTIYHVRCEVSSSGVGCAHYRFVAAAACVRWMAEADTF